MSTCFVRDLQGNDILVGNRGSDLYTISLQESTSSTSFCLMAKAIPTQARLWHRRHSHLNFDYINLLSKKDIMIGLPKLKKANLLHMDLCGPMRVASISGKKYVLIVQLILFIVDSGCMKHITGNLQLLCNFVEKFLGTVRFGNDQFAPILRYGDLVQGNVTINRVYYVKGLNHNLFSVGQFCDADLEVALAL
nr:integrase, catalytic region, zinc finger, CCHC-type, peptidase aspartic, catalytic [Tanacetum cinerariifolium]